MRNVTLLSSAMNPINRTVKQRKIKGYKWSAKGGVRALRGLFLAHQLWEVWLGHVWRQLASTWPEACSRGMSKLKHGVGLRKHTCHRGCNFQRHAQVIIWRKCKQHCQDMLLNQRHGVRQWRPVVANSHGLDIVSVGCWCVYDRR